MKSSTLLKSVLCLAAAVLAGCDKDDPNEISMDMISNGIITVVGADGVSYDAVDLGLPSGTLWATHNIGATEPYQYGDYFAWGETTSNRNEYRWDTYPLSSEHDAFSFTRYCTNDDYGTVDNRKTLLPEDDAARMHWGGAWRMPTEAEFDELRSRCDKRYCKLDGVWGFLLTSKSKGFDDRRLFFPCAGQYDNIQLKFKEKYGFYWSCTLANTPQQAYIFSVEHKDDLDNVVVNQKVRYIGLPVRPVATGE